MKYAILIVNKPSSDNMKEQDKWKKFSDWLETTDAKNLARQRIGENVWEFDLQNAFGVLSRIVVRAEDEKLTYRVLFLDQENSWIES